jgi:nicotinate-nucleotide pyrophosphorylase (carboxylating)
MMELNPIYLERVVTAALEEDIGSGDITTALTVPENLGAVGVLLAKKAGIIAGLVVAQAAFRTVDVYVALDSRVKEGDPVSAGSQIAIASGNARAILTAERVALNFLQRMSGIATLTSRFVSQVAHTEARIIDTRKTTPGLRALEKYAVRLGGGHNHRFGLFDGILIKDNHIAATGGVKQAVEFAKRNAPHPLKVEVEVTNLDELQQAISAEADAVLLDNMSCDMMRQAVEIGQGKVTFEASGGVSLDNVREIAETGVDLISIGALTHSAPALDISLELR